MEIYNRRTPGSVTGIVFLLLGISGVLENISDMWVNFTLGKEIQKLDQTLARDSFLAGCFEGVFALLFLILAFAGVVKITRVIRFWRIKRILGDRAMISLEELSRKLHCSQKRLRRELEKMIQHNFFLQGHLNQEYTCFIVTDRRYKEYQKILSEWKREQSYWQEKGFDEEKQKVVEQAQNCLTEIRSLTERICLQNQTDFGMEADLQKLEKGVEKLISACRHDPQNLPQMSLFLNYYLPTAEKFVREYAWIADGEQTGDNREELRRELFKGVRELAEAFEELSQRLCDSMESNIFDDIAALEKMMEQREKGGYLGDRKKVFKRG